MTHAASGAAATEARLAIFSSNESALVSISFWMATQFSGVILAGSSERMSSLTPRFAKKLFMLFHDVSRMPIMRSTPSRMSRITSGGARNDRISDKASDLICPTAARASLSSGSTSFSCTSMALVRSCNFLLLASVALRSSNKSVFWSEALRIVDEINSSDWAANFLFSFRASCCSAASPRSRSTMRCASESFSIPHWMDRQTYGTERERAEPQRKDGD